MQNKTESNGQMPLVTPEARTLLLCFNETTETTQREGEEESVTTYKYDSARVDKTADRGQIIDAIVRSRYTQSQMEALNNNYLDPEHSEEDVEKWNAMQNWRKQAKTIADEVLTAKAELAL